MNSIDTRGALALMIRHDGTSRVVGGPATSISFRDAEGFEHKPIVRSIRYEIDADGPVGGLPSVTVEWDGLTAHLDVVAELSEPIHGCDTKRVHVVCDGISRRTKVRDADTGEDILTTSVRVELTAGGQALAWVVPWNPEANASAESA